MSDTAGAPPKESTSTGTSFSTVTTSVLIFVLLVTGIAIIAYILSASLNLSYPISPFNYGDTVTIRPAIPTQGVTDEYLTQSGFLRNSQLCLAPYGYGSSSSTDAFAVTFNGKADDPKSQWILQQFSNPFHYDSDQSFLYGQGNRFYLQNKSNPTDATGRLRYQVLNESSAAFLHGGLCYSTTPAVIGANGDELCNWFETDLLIYFYPTKFPNLFYLLFPSCAALANDTTAQPNDGIISIRAWGANFGQGNDKGGTAEQCLPCDNNGTFNPYVEGVVSNGLNPNVPILNYLPPGNTRLAPFPNANVLLFEVVKLGQ